MPASLTKQHAAVHLLERGGATPHSKGWRRLAEPLLLASLSLVAFYPVVLWYFARVTDGSDEPYGIIALSLAGYFLWFQHGSLRPSPSGWIVAAVATVAYAALHQNLPPMLRALLAIVALVFATGIIRSNPGVAALFVLSLPLVASIQFYCGYPLRVLVAASTSGILNLIGLTVGREGTVLEWGGRLVAVDAPCSGVKMLWTGCTLAACLAAATALTFIRTIFLAGIAVALVVAANVARGFLLFFKESGALALPGWTHTAIGIACFLVFAFVLTRISARLTIRSSPIS